MIRHVVMWRVAGGCAQEKAQNMNLIRESFDSLRNRVPGLLRLEIGADTSGVDYACDLVLVSDFESQAALDAYAIHPEHLRVRQVIGDRRTHRYQVDYAVPEAGPMKPTNPQQHE